METKKSRHSTIAIAHKDKELNRNLLAILPTYSAKRLFSEMQNDYAQKVCLRDPARFAAVTGFTYCPDGKRVNSIDDCGGTNDGTEEKEQMPNVQPNTKE